MHIEMFSEFFVIVISEYVQILFNEFKCIGSLNFSFYGLLSQEKGFKRFNEIIE